MKSTSIKIITALLGVFIIISKPVFSQPGRVEQLLVDFHNNHLGGTDYSEKIVFPKPLTHGQKKAYKGLVLAIGADAAILISAGSSEAIVQYISIADISSSIIMDYNANKRTGEIRFNTVIDLLKDEFIELGESVASLRSSSTQNIPGLRSIVSAGFVVVENYDAAIESSDEIFQEISRQKEIWRFVELIPTEIKEINNAIALIGDTNLRKEYEWVFFEMVHRKAELAVYKQRVLDSDNSTVAAKTYEIIKEGKESIGESTNFFLNINDYLAGWLSDNVLVHVIDSELKKYGNKIKIDEVIEYSNLENIHRKVNLYGGNYLEPEQRVTRYIDIKESIPHTIKVDNTFVRIEDIRNSIAKFVSIEEPPLILTGYNELAENLLDDNGSGKENDHSTSSEFILTKNIVKDTDDWNKTVVNEFGENYRVADWNDLILYCSNGKDLKLLLNDIGLNGGIKNAFVTKDGNKRYSSNRYYFVTRHNGEVSSGYAEHDQLNNHLLSLGSWHTSQRILAIKRRPEEAKLQTDFGKNKQAILEKYGMVLVDGGTFQMGSNDGNENERPVHKVTLSSFYISKYEYTQQLWQEIMDTNPSRFKGSNNPVEQVSWYDVQTFIKKLNQKTGMNFRLPTEAEWEFAARGGNSSRGYKYSGSNALSSVACFNENSYDKGKNHTDYGTHPVGQKQSNELGLYDMSGNVWEWCNDRYDSRYYSSSLRQNPKGPSSGFARVGRVGRGGCWANDANDCRVAIRGAYDPYAGFTWVGFRVAHSSTPKEVGLLDKSKQEQESSDTNYYIDKRDGKKYKTVKIGNQVWMAENLAYLPSVNAPFEGSNTQLRYYVYDYSGRSVKEAKTTKNYQTYGVLYNWPAAVRVCPEGWHLPSDREWKTLEAFLGIPNNKLNEINFRGSNEGNKLKAKKIWEFNTYNTDEYSFSGLPAGYRDFEGDFLNINEYAIWWTSTSTSTIHARNRGIVAQMPMINRFSNEKNNGFSVRCIKD